jgi:hypothetical protein
MKPAVVLLSGRLDSATSVRSAGATAAGTPGGAGGTTAAEVVEAGGGGGVVGVPCASARDKAAESPTPKATAMTSWGLVPSRPRSAMRLPALTVACMCRCPAITSA